MNHPKREEWVAYLYGELDRKRRAELEAHLRSCGECQVEIDAWRGVVAELDRWELPKGRGRAVKVRQSMQWVRRWAVAAVLLIVVGYAVGRLSALPSVDVEQLHYSLETSLKSSLEPVIRRGVLEEVDRELNEFAAQTLAASTTVTNQLLTELIQAIGAAQTQERRGIAAALERMELNRLRDNAQLRNDLVSFAVQTEDELLRTRQDVVQWIAYSRPYNFVPDESENLETIRRKE